MPEQARCVGSLVSESFQAHHLLLELGAARPSEPIHKFAGGGILQKTQHFRGSWLIIEPELESEEPAGTTFDLILFDGPLKLSFILSAEKAHFVCRSAPRRLAEQQLATTIGIRGQFCLSGFRRCNLLAGFSRQSNWPSSRKSPLAGRRANQRWLVSR